MNTTTTIERAGRELIDLTKMQLQPAELFAPGGMNGLLERLEAEARCIAPDISTAKGRKAIASTAARIARSKTYLDGLGKDFNAKLKEQTKAVDAERRAMRERLDVLRDEVRQPLTAFEEQEAKRQAAIRERITALGAELPQTSAEVASRLADLEGVRIDDTWQEFAADAARAKDAAVMQARAALAVIQEREQAEAERRAAVEQARLEREEQIRSEATEQARAEAENAAREATEKLQREQEERQLARDRELLEAERRAVEAERLQREAEANANRDQAAAAERARAEALERFRHEQAEETRKEAQRRQEELKRSQDQEHRKQVNRDAAAELVMCTGINTDQAHAVIVAIVRGQGPNVTITY